MSVDTSPAVDRGRLGSDSEWNLGVRETDGAEGLADLAGAAIARRLVDDMVLSALERVGQAGITVPAVDWLAIWRAGDEARTPERRLGRIVIAAASVANQLDRLHPAVELTPSTATVTPSWWAQPGAPPRERRRLVRTRRGPVVAATHLARAFSWIRNIGLILLLFVAWQLWGTGLQEGPAQQDLALQFATQVHRSQLSPRPDTAPRALPALLTSADVTPPTGTLVGRVDIPAISLSQYVVEGVNTQNLEEGPGHYPGTALPGYAGNVAIAGHRTTYGAPFNALGRIRLGDLIYVTGLSGTRLTYRVTRPPVAVAPTDVAVLDNFGDNRLTLTTCTPEFSAAQRLVVVATLDEKVATAVAHGLVRPSSHGAAARAPAGAELSGSNGSGGRLLRAVLAGASLVLLGLAYRRVRSRLGLLRTVFLLTPAWTVGLLVLFTEGGKLLPSSI